MFSKVLIANRGEIALRILRACRELGIRSVVAYSEADRDSLPVREADEAICIGPPPSSKSYLHIPNIVTAALITGADAIHPGYGFLAENPYLAEVCDRCQVVFVGPSSSAIEKMSDKSVARRLMKAIGIPVIPGSEEPLKNLREAQALAEAIGYPVMLKAAAGGGGRGLRIASSDAEMERFYTLARMEAEASFGSGDLYLEKVLSEPRHVEVQVLADNHGNIIHLGDRDCSLQRRHQKLIEEAPAPFLSQALRTQLYEWSLKGATHIGYTNAGTFEFLVDKGGQACFIEMNTRIQVEHPVTEMITGIDIVQWQLRIAAGEPLAYRQEDLAFRGHAIECRINAEDSQHDFQPQGGGITSYLPPGGPGIRVDSHLYTGYTLPPQYDSLLAKIVAWGEDRDMAIKRMTRALSECSIAGVKTTTSFLRGIMQDPRFVKGEISTVFLEQYPMDIGIEDETVAERVLDKRR